MNVLTISGNLGRDARIGASGGTAVANFSVAAKAGFGEREQTIWVDCSLWGKQAESGLIDYLKKGQQVVVSGEMGTRDYEGKTYVTMRVNTITLVGGRQEQSPSQQAPQQQYQAQPRAAQQAQAPQDDFVDDIPF